MFDFVYNSKDFMKKLLLLLFMMPALSLCMQGPSGDHHNPTREIIDISENTKKTTSFSKDLSLVLIGAKSSDVATDEQNGILLNITKQLRENAKYSHVYNNIQEERAVAKAIHRVKTNRTNRLRDKSAPRSLNLDS